jgi:3-dehydroquinate synthase
MKLPDNILITGQIADSVRGFFAKNTYSAVAVLMDENTERYCFPLLQEVLPDHVPIIIRSGESYKNLETCARIWQHLTDWAFDRKSLLVNLGGGVIGDMGGFCAATYKRGIDFMNIPTTLLSQVDASIGGKLGIDFLMYKNHIGVFQEPKQVMVDPVFLQTLPEAELRSGYAEVIKHGLICDADTFTKLASLPLADVQWSIEIPRSIEIKYQVVKDDPKEVGYRKILNFGHTLGHAVESYYLKNSAKRLLHGEAIAVGMICEAWLSFKKTGLPQRALEQTEQLLMTIYDCAPIPEEHWPAIIELTRQDKKNEKGKVFASLLKNIGVCTFNVPLTEDEMIASLRHFNALAVK